MYWNNSCGYNSLNPAKLNSNIRCIEIELAALGDVPEIMLNSNIRCIEMREDRLGTHDRSSWIVTLDVLK